MDRVIDNTEVVALISKPFDAVAMFEPMEVESMIELIEVKAVDFEADIGTKKGQDLFRSRAATVARIKTTWIKEGKERNKAINIEVKERNSQCNKIDDRLTELQAKVRKPLTDFENSIKMAEAEHTRLLSRLAELSNAPSDLSVAELQNIMDSASAIEITGDVLSDRYSEATVAKENAVASLVAKISVRAQHDKDQAELAELRAEREKQEALAAKAKEELIRKEREEGIRAEAAKLAEREAASKAEQEAAMVEEDKIAEADKLAAAEKAIEDAERQKEEAVLLAKAQERERFAKEAAELKEAARISREADEKKAANKAHRSKIKKESVKFLAGIEGVTDKQAKAIFDAISYGDVPHIKVNY